MDIEVLAAGALGGVRAERWARALSAPGRPAHPVLSPDFARAVGGVRPAARVAVLESDGRCGWLGFEERGHGVGEVIGKGFTDVGGLLCEPGLPRPDYRAVLAACGLAVWRFVQAEPAGPPLGGAGTAVPPGVRPLGRVPSPLADLSEGYEAHRTAVRRRSPASAKTLRKHENRLARGEVPVRYVFDERDPRLLGTMLRWKSAQYRASGWSDPLAAERGTELARVLAGLRTPTCTGALSVLYLGDEPAAMQLTLRSATVLTCCVTAFDHRYAAHSPGTVLLGRVIATAAELGVTTVDLGTGDSEYKQAFTTEERTLPQGLLWRPTLVAGGALLHDAAERTARDFITARPWLRSRVRGALRRYGTLRG
ncbi:GNAT family N-acetyltransferase [Streptomyces sp. N2A]|uniref:GNAT family N-acetyltransferase n=1 Tax=Streptomyces sp. N2A TaxID=3073936 RepID=UPI0028709CB7|nr:GNAT family N-acetyltransferase [Streptomyces sp. N2A]